MKNKILNTIIVLLTFFAAYVFYGIWHSDTLNKKEYTPPKKTEPKSLHDKELTPKQTFTIEEKLKKEEKPVPTPKTQSQKPTFKTPQEIETETQEIYEKLKPTEHEMVIQEAQEHYEAIQERVVEVDEQIQAEEESIRESETLQDEVRLEEDIDESQEIVEDVQEAFTPDESNLVEEQEE